MGIGTKAVTLGRGVESSPSLGHLLLPLVLVGSEVIG